MSDFSNSQGAGTGASPAPAQFPTYIPSAYAQYRDVRVPGLGNPATPQPPTGGSYALANAGLTDESSTAFHPTMENALQALLLDHDPKQILATQKELIRAGYLNPADPSFIPGQVDSSDITYNAYALALNDSIEQREGYNKLLNSRIDNPHDTTGQAYWRAFQAKIAGTDGSGGGPTTTTTSETSTNLTSPTEARATAQTEYASLLGRNPTDAEAAAFTAGLNAAEHADPSMSSSTSTHDATSGDTTTNSTTSGGVNAAEVADSDIITKHGKEYAKSQGEQVYQLFNSLIGGGA